MFGLGKHRTKLGRFLDRNKITQQALCKAAKISREVMADLCGTDGYNPHSKTKIKIVGALRRMGYNVSPEDFWD